MSCCPCCSGLVYELCCAPFHLGIKLPSDALQLMRSRYAAYVLGLAEYIIQTTHPASPQYEENLGRWAEKVIEFSSQAKFSRLEVLEHKERGELATVVFVVHLTLDGADGTFTEKSFFQKKGERWLYRAGQLVGGRAPNLITKGQMRLLPLSYYGEPILRQEGAFVGEITGSVRSLVEEMIETMDACDGLGLAAPQVHHSLRLFVIRVPQEEKSGEIRLGQVKVMLNSEISSPSKETWRASEGCLSIPGVHALVRRPKEITVEYTDLEGKRICERCRGWEARVILHEHDHTRGVLFIDRLEKKEKKNLDSLLERLRFRIHGSRDL